MTGVIPLAARNLYRRDVSKKPDRRPLPLNPAHPERVCWGCDQYCLAEDLGCGNGTIRTPHPAELFGDDWLDWSLDGKTTKSNPQEKK